MAESPQPPGKIRFGVFEMNLRSGELRKHGMKVRLQEQPFRVLAMLVEHAGDVVTREELQKAIWPADTFVDFDHGLNKAINKIRQALGDSAESPRYVETVARRGYRFLAEVKDVESAGRPAEPLGGAAAGSSAASEDTDEVPVADPSSDENQPVAPLRTKVFAAIAALLIVGVAAWIFYAKNRRSQEIRSLAVLPLESLSGDPSQDYFADGMTDELITNLGQISALRVISRTSVMPYKKSGKPLPQIARELNVDAIVEGTVLRSGDQVRITAQLIQAASDKHLWAQSYEGDLRDTLALQSRVAAAIADRIRVHLNPQEEAALKNEKAVNPEAYVSYLKGRFFWNKRTAEGLKQAETFFNQAIQVDPSYAQAYSGLADTYALLGDWQYAVMTAKEALPKAKAAALKAIELDAKLSEAHNSLAFCLEGFDWDFKGAEKEFQRAIQLNPGYATAHHWYAWHLSLMGRNAEAIAEMRKAQNLDPLSAIINADLAELLVIAGLYDEAIQQSRQTIAMDPNFGFAHNQMAQAYMEKGMYDDAIAELQKAIALSGGCPTCTANLARAYAATGKRDEAMALSRELIKSSGVGHTHAPEIAVVYAALGDKDQAMAWLEKGYEERFNPGVLIRPGLGPLRSDPRFQTLVRRIGLNLTADQPSSP